MWAVFQSCFEDGEAFGLGTLPERLVRVLEARCRTPIYGTWVSFAEWYDVCQRGELQPLLCWGCFFLVPMKRWSGWRKGSSGGDALWPASRGADGQGFREGRSWVCKSRMFYTQGWELQRSHSWWGRKWPSGLSSNVPSSAWATTAPPHPPPLLCCSLTHGLADFFKALLWCN